MKISALLCKKALRRKTSQEIVKREEEKSKKRNFLLKDLDWAMEILMKRGYSEKDGKEILKVGRQLGINFNDDSQALKNLALMEKVDDY